MTLIWAMYITRETEQLRIYTGIFFFYLWRIITDQESWVQLLLLPRDLKSSVPANLPSKKTVLFSVLNIRLMRTKTTSIEPERDTYAQTDQYKIN